MGRKAYLRINKKCTICNVEFITIMSSKRLYCSRSCQSKGIKRNDSRKTHICQICKNEFKSYGNGSLCGRECFAKYMSIARKGIGNPAYKTEDKKQTGICVFCNSEFKYKRSGLHIGQQRKTCDDCYKKIKLERTNKIASIGYPIEFNNALRLKIRERDGYICKSCGKKQNDLKKKLSVHHIDSNKQNCKEDNLISLCNSCHFRFHNYTDVGPYMFFLKNILNINDSINLLTIKEAIDESDEVTRLFNNELDKDIKKLHQLFEERNELLRKA